MLWFSFKHTPRNPLTPINQTPTGIKNTSNLLISDITCSILRKNQKQEVYLNTAIWRVLYQLANLTWCNTLIGFRRQCAAACSTRLGSRKDWEQLYSVGSPAPAWNWIYLQEPKSILLRSPTDASSWHCNLPKQKSVHAKDKVTQRRVGSTWPERFNSWWQILQMSMLPPSQWEPRQCSLDVNSALPQ